MIREPVVAGTFYPANSDALRSQIESMVDKKANPEKALGTVSPHAGYQFSGVVACEVFSKIKITDTVIILGPNHTGFGKPFALYAEGNWRTPFGDISIDKEFSEALLKKTNLIEEDVTAHASEHSLEVQVPVMQYFKPDFKIVPIVIGIAGFKKCLEAAEAIAAVIKESGKEVLIVASSDMTHYESQDDAKKKDKIAIDAVLKLDENLLLKNVGKYNITMCGYIPVIIMIAAVKALGATSARLVKYQTSGDITGDYSQVVGYAGIIIE
jgi:AmmeMemoRadiSam system protein B